MGGSIRGQLAVLVTVILPAVSLAGDPRLTLLAELKKRVARGLPSVSIAVAPQSVNWMDAVGLADMPSHSCAHPGNLHGMGSVTIVFVACVVQQLMDEGRLSADSRARDILGRGLLDGIPNGDRAAVRQLLEHTNGIPTSEFDAR